MEGTPAPPAFLVLVAWFGSESEAYAKTLPVIEYHLGCAYARQGYVAKARGALRSSLEHDPQYGPAQQELSRLQYQLQGGVRASAAEPGRQS
jgi:Tfp pilus assembly protein PilF